MNKIPDGFAKHQRVSSEGYELGTATHRFYILGEQILRRQNEDTRDCCQSCAFLRGTVPNGCAQTQLDAMKAVVEQVPFMCHVETVGNVRKVCAGWFAAVQVVKALKAAGVRMPELTYAFSPPEDAVNDPNLRESENNGFRQTDQKLGNGLGQDG
jgi:hypothetical protein